MLHFYRPTSPPSEGPAKFAITGALNTSMPVTLAPRKQPEKQITSSVASKNTTRSSDDDEPFILPW